MSPLKLTPICLGAAALLLNACATTSSHIAQLEPQLSVGDPQQMTAVVNAKFTITGSQAPDITGTQLVLTRDNRRRISNDIRFSHMMLKWANSQDSTFFHIDRDQTQLADDSQKTYRNCALNSCDDFKFDWNPQPDEEATNADTDGQADQCQIRLTKEDYVVKPTGQKKEIAGILSQEYLVEWRTEMKDSAGNKDTNILRIKVWAIPPTQSMHQAWTVHQAFTDDYLAKTGNNHDLSRLIGEDGVRALSAFSGDTQHSNSNQYNRYTRELRKIKGYPLSIDLAWYANHNTCPEQTDSTDNSATHSGDSLEEAAVGFLGGLAENAVDGLSEKDPNAWQNTPIFQYLYEVTNVRMMPVADLFLEVPADYTKIVADKDNTATN